MYPCTDTRPCAGDAAVRDVSSGDATCNVGYYGPLCAVCEEGYFSFSNGCTCVYALTVPETQEARIRLQRCTTTLLASHLGHQSMVGQQTDAGVL